VSPVRIRPGLSDEEASAYGVYRGAPSQSDLEKLFFLDDADRQLIAKRRGAHNRLGVALLLTTVRYLGVFLTDPLDVPDGVVGYLAGQLEISDPGCVRRYTERRTTRFEHADEIRAACGLREFDQVDKELREWVDARAWTTGTVRRPSSPTRCAGCGNAMCCCRASPRSRGWSRRSARRRISGCGTPCTGC